MTTNNQKHITTATSEEIAALSAKLDEIMQRLDTVSRDLGVLDVQNKHLGKHLTEIDQGFKALDRVMRGVEVEQVEDHADYLDITCEQVEHYISNSGNPTWKAHMKDGSLIYLRQAHRDLLTKAGLWHKLNEMQVGDVWGADLIIGSIPDGDFRKPVKFYGEIISPKRSALAWVKMLCSDTQYVVIDTETTSLKGEVCQLAILSPTGEVLLDTLVRPRGSITADASAIHGITNEMVRTAPTIEALADQIMSILGERTVAVGWNVYFDRDSLLRSAQSEALITRINSISYFDLMQTYSDHIAREWSDYHGNYKWQKLTSAARYYGISTEGAHGALADCRMTLAVMQKMAEEYENA
jgi:DNA polymerase-3 subunit epsilon